MNPFTTYVEAGLSAIPIRGDGSKAAAVSWRPFTRQRPSLDQCRDWDRQQHPGIALIAGAVSGNLEVIDVDEPSLTGAYLEAVSAADPTLVDRLTMIRTPRRNESGQAGLHLLYRCEQPIGPSAKLAMSEPEPSVDEHGRPLTDAKTGRPRTLIETKGEGGYVLTVGCSPACHPTGRCYEHIGGPPLEQLATLAQGERETLHRVARMFDRSITETHQEPRESLGRTVPGELPGEGFNRRTSWPEILEPHGWVCVGEHGGIRQWRRPGKATGVSATTGLLSKQGNELFVCFSTNAAPFEGVQQNRRPGVCYSKFSAYTLLNHDGDYREAARHLASLGFGDPPPTPERPNRVLHLTGEEAERRYLEALLAGEMELISTGIEPLDRALGGGVERGEMVILGGLPSHGKSVCGLQTLRATVERGEHGVLVSHEMGALTIAKRLLASRTTLEPEQWRHHVPQLQANSMVYWATRGKLFILEQTRAIEAIEKQIGAIAAEYDLTSIVIDHAQLTVGQGNSRYEKLTDASGKFKELAVKHNAVVYVLSQLSREAARFGDAESHHLKESGALEQDADCIVFVRWPWKADPDKHQPNHYELKVTKNRNRPIVEWQVEAEFNPACQTISATAGSWLARNLTSPN